MAHESQAVPDSPHSGTIDTVAIHRLVNQSIKDGELPGAVIVIADHDHVLYQQAFGNRRVKPTCEPMTLDTVFDLASLTKPIATATSVMCLVQDGKIDVNLPTNKYLPEFAGQGKESITVSDLLLHLGGLIPDNSIQDYQDGSQASWERICALKPIAKHGEKFFYTDVGYIVLGKLVQRVSGKTLDQFVVDEVFQPLAMNHTMYNPTNEMKAKSAPTEKRDGAWMTGEVHDPRAHLLDGVAGHAGLFSTASDLVRYGQMMLNGGRLRTVTIFDESTYRLMATPRKIPGGTRTFGWDHQSAYSKNRGDRFSDAAFGHGGFTGTVMWIDPKKDRVYIFLSNRLHPDGKGTVNRLAGKIATIAGQAASE